MFFKPPLAPKNIFLTKDPAQETQSNGKTFIPGTSNKADNIFHSDGTDIST